MNSCTVIETKQTLPEPLLNADFFAYARKHIFGGMLTQNQVDNLNLIAEYFQKFGMNDRRQLAYIFATVLRECGRQFEPVRETFATSDSQAISRLDNAWAKGQLKWVSKPYWRTGFFGRGFVQLTHLSNYERATKELGIDFVRSPGAALEPKYAAQIIVIGMRDGWFTVKKLSDYINEKGVDFYNARRIVNGLDAASEIKANALKFAKALGT